MNNPYQVLGVPTSASQGEIKQTFRHLAKIHHPDLNNGNVQSKEKFQEIAEAYAILSDPASRALWDKESESIMSGGDSWDDSAYYGDIKAAAEDIENFIHAMHEQIEPYKDYAKRSVGAGMAWLIGGLVVTVGSYMAAVSSGGGSYVIAWGAILFGGIQAVRSFYNYSKINRTVKELEEEMWKILS